MNLTEIKTEAIRIAGKYYRKGAQANIEKCKGAHELAGWVNTLALIVMFQEPTGKDDAARLLKMVSECKKA